ncbi:vWA domain-containing protein [Uliginosibacterium aquaticum]|uniref:VWA domain-containing protein n=1 Tax=Uliginosibacterium aquaticum TaxID=2731212 RepID=A0ABX2IQV8_9RHOO|nr:VWA domain-containing protein [Uliginosibacterium aquaticum]NSL56618.1 VWA domain-containing protein [Uliginosibacterium aquaticum]
MKPRLASALLVTLLVACVSTQSENPPASRAATNTQAPQPVREPAPRPVAPPAPAATKVAEVRSVSADMARMIAMPAPIPMQAPAPDRERYGPLTDNPVKRVAEAPVSTFSIDVDTGSYSNVRRMLNAGRLPPADAVRVEELINYFPYDYAQPQDGRPFAVHTELAPAPWNSERVLLRIGIKGVDVAKASLPPANLVFLVDVSGSMNSADKLPLLKSSLKLLVNELRPQDRISLVTYASGTQVVLPPTAGSDKATLIAAIDGLRAGGSTAGASGIQLAYTAAQQSFIKGGINRILLATDGDFNVGINDTRQLKSLIEEKRKSGISLSTLGFGTGNYNEAMMEQIADVGDGAYSYIDSLMEGHKVLVNEMTSTLATIARDVKVQIEFNPAVVREYRQIGYENRQLAREDFNNDKVDAGDIGAGHTVTALYELTLVEGKPSVDDLRYAPQPPREGPLANELGHLKLRYKLPAASSSQLIDFALQRSAIKPLAAASSEFRFATAVAGVGQLLRGGKYTGDWGYAQARELAVMNLGQDRFGYRGEFLRLLDLATALGTRPVQ